MCRQWIDLAICAVPDGLVGQAGRTRTDRRHRRPADARRINRNDLIGPGAVAAWSARTDFIWPCIEPGLALEVNGGWRPSLASAAGWGARRRRQWGGLRLSTSSQWERSVRAPSRPNLPRRYPSRLALPCPALSCPVLSCPVLPCPALPCPALPCPALSCLILSLGPPCPAPPRPASFPPPLSAPLGPLPPSSLSPNCRPAAVRLAVLCFPPVYVKSCGHTGSVDRRS